MIEHEPDPLRRIPTKHTAEIHAEIGSVLRAARLKRGQSLEAVAQQTRIPKRYLESLENDRLDEFPAFVYMRGFLKGYCEHLDVPFEQLWAKIQPPEAAAASASAPAAPAAVAGASAPATSGAGRAAAPAPAHTPPPAAHAAPTTHAASAAPAPSATGAIVFALALAVGLGVWLVKDRQPAAVAPQAESTPRALLPLPKTTETKVGLRAIDDAWVRVTVDDKVAFEGRLPRGASMQWTPSHSVSLRTTSPSSLQLTVNGVPQALANPTPDGEYRIEVQ
ncbi:MAG TPA: helix-turn-helix domain-containing protein [Elusimicrobiota bacterium]|nr:helix-turn-helix domain-containing protein [Elusimicrobiota bacterium]